jgi:predicted glycosyltransferase
MQKRAIFFVFDGGSGIGHLRRLANIARALQGDFSCLIVTGHRAAAHWFVPDECEYIHVPSWDSLLGSKAQYWGRKPFLCIDENSAVDLRKSMLRGVVDAYKPDVIFVDHLPLGMREELRDIIKDTPCLKYLVTRGVLNESHDNNKLLLAGEAREYIERYYEKVLVAIDSNVFDFSKEYAVHSGIRAKTAFVGYVVDPISPELIAQTRKSRGLGPEDTWVVAAAGGGQLGEKLIETCQELAARHKNILFDVVLGPRSNLPWDDTYKSMLQKGNLHLHRETPHMSKLHASADVVICSGGYNSILEALQGDAKILCVPTWKSERDEQYVHASNLRRYVDIRVTLETAGLSRMFDELSSEGKVGHDRRRELNFSGTQNIQRMVLEDLSRVK